MTKRMKTEYMKKFKGPKWDNYGSCYSDLVQYRNMRRILEQAHIPWVWTGWDTSSNSSSGASTPGVQEQPWGTTCLADSLLAAPQVPGGSPPAERPRTEPPPAERPRTEPPPAERPRTEPPPAERPRTEPPPAERPRTVECYPLEKEMTVEDQKDKSDQQSKGGVCNYRRVKGASLEKPHKTSQVAPATVRTKEMKPPFAMYGWAEKEVEVGCKKTYNVGASALRGQIYESAVRAQDRRQVQRAMRVSRTRHRGTEPGSNRAADHWCKTFQSHKPASQHSRIQALKPTGVDNPWLSEYMRCFSTRSF
ncbi:centriole, cilia and spindle-associated protein-like [Hypanus sabinus]|uniref:centriole, cilia and spindle-associated protein-like n=1 Tax=Hypanus sabinus TaxID=79690 RepID=UPI0028C3D7E8|nr:centriole, cilia and spindle-associated protein-like [Hypanus sabinus]